MDNEDGLLTEQLRTKPAFDTLGSTADEIAKQHAEREASGGAIPGPAPSELIIPVGDPMGKKLLRTMGWREGQGVGSRVRRKRRRPVPAEGDESPDEDLPEKALAGLGGKARELLDKEGAAAKAGHSRGPRASAALHRGSHGFVLDDGEDDVYEAGFGKEEYDVALDEAVHDSLAGAKAWAVGGASPEDKPMLASRRFARCPSDGRLPPSGFVVAHRPDVEQKHWAPPTPPENFRPTIEFEKDAGPLQLGITRRHGDAGLDASMRARLLGEPSSQPVSCTPTAPTVSLDQGKARLPEVSSALSFLSPAARKKLLDAANGTKAPSRFSSPSGGASTEHAVGAGDARRQENASQPSEGLQFSLASKFISEKSPGAKVQFVPESSATSQPMIPLLRGMEQRHPVGIVPPSATISDAAASAVPEATLKERPPIDLFKSIFESESESDSDDEDESGGEGATAAAAGEAGSSPTSPPTEIQKVPESLFDKKSFHRGYGTDSSDESSETGAGQLGAAHRVDAYHSKKPKQGRISGVEGKRLRGESDSTSRLARKHKKHKKHKKDKQAMLVLVASVAFLLARLALADECHDICADVKKVVNCKAGCSAFRNSLPRPKVSSTCQSAFKTAVDLNCYDACTNGGYLQPFVSESRMNEACKNAVRESPRPLCHDACVRGYRSGVKDMTTLLVKRMTELIASANSEVAPSSRTVGPGISGPEFLGTEVKEPEEGSEMEFQEPEEVKKVVEVGEMESQKHEDENLDAITGQTEKVNVIHDESPFSDGEVIKVYNNEEVENESKPAAADVDSEEVGDQHEAGIEEEKDVYTWIEEESKVLLSLPITVDNVEKELAIFEGDEPMDVVLEFCRDNMPGEAACADELIGVVVNKIAPRST
eukprot:g2026.t1